MPKQTQKSGSKPSITNITKHLSGIDFPARKQDLIEHAKSIGVDDSVMNMLNELDDREYDSMKDVMKEYGEKYEKAA